MHLLLLIHVGAVKEAPMEEGHAIYISVIEVKQNGPDTGLVSIKVFQDDFADALRNFTGKPIIGENGLECDANEEVINAYFSRYLSLTIDQQILSLELNTCETVGDSYWLDFSCKVPQDWPSIKVKATFFMELFPVQTNIISVTYQEQKKMVKTTKSDPEKIIRFTD